MTIQLTKSLFLQYAAIVAVNLSMIVTGMSIAWPSPMLIKLRNETLTPLTRAITNEEGSWIVSLGYLATIITNVVAGGLMNIIGRKGSLLLLSLPRFAMILFCTLASEVWMVIFTRTIIIMIDCMYLVMVPVYASEIAGKNQRGTLGTFLQIFTCLGAVLTLSLGPFITYKNFNIVLTSTSAATSVVLLFLPETPYFLYSKGYTSKAIEVLFAIRSEEEAKEEIEELKVGKAALAKEKIKITYFINSKVRIKSLLLGFLVSIGIQIIGYNVVTFYLQTILELTNTKIRSEIASLIISLIELFAGFCTAIIANKFARKFILAWSLNGYILGMTNAEVLGITHFRNSKKLHVPNQKLNIYKNNVYCMFIRIYNQIPDSLKSLPVKRFRKKMGLATFFSLRDYGGYSVTGFLNFLPTISLIVVIFCYSSGIGNLIWLILGEIFDGPGRALGVSISLIMCNITIFLTTKYFYLMTEVFGSAGTFWFYAAMAVVINVLTNVFLPETKDKSFNEIQRVLGGGSGEELM